jgi:hypothetical protein
MRTVRAQLAAERITHCEYAEACGLNRSYVSHLLAGSEQSDKLTRIKMARAQSR